MEYTIIGKFSEINIDNFSRLDLQSLYKNKIFKKKTLFYITTSLVLFITIQDISFADSAVQTFDEPQLKPLFEFIQWLIRLLRIVVSSIMGLISTFAGYKWATSIDSNSTESAKKILKNAAVGSLIVWFGTKIVDIFVKELNSLL